MAVKFQLSAVGLIAVFSLGPIQPSLGQLYGDILHGTYEGCSFAKGMIQRLHACSNYINGPNFRSDNLAQKSTALRYRAGYYLEEGDFKRALPDIEHALRLNTNDAHAFSLRGIAHFQMGDTAKAMEDANHGVSLGKNNSEVFYVRAVLNEKLGNTQAAIADYTQSVKLKYDDNRSVGALNRLGATVPERPYVSVSPIQHESPPVEKYHAPPIQKIEAPAIRKFEAPPIRRSEPPRRN